MQLLPLMTSALLPHPLPLTVSTAPILLTVPSPTHQIATPWETCKAGVCCCVYMGMSGEMVGIGRDFIVQLALVLLPLPQVQQ